MNIKVFRSFLLLAVVTTACVLAGTACAGTFRDRDGAAHPWLISKAHVLIWEGSPYVPFGIVFEPRYLTSGQTDENWAADEREIAALTQAGVADVILKPGGGIASAPVDAFQRVIDLLETNDLRYGVELCDPPYEPLVGYVIEPTLYRVDGIQSSGWFSRRFADTKTALYAVCNAKTAEVVDSGRVLAINDEVGVQVTLPVGGEHVLLFYPQKVIPGGSAEGLPDIWSDYDRHRDRVVWYLSRVKFGKGLRFFIDPFTEEFGIRGDVEGMVPTSTAFRLEYSAWLSRKYGAPADLSLSWGILRHDVSSFEEAVRLIPLWRNARGVPAVYDEATAKKHPVDAVKSSLWGDFLEFRSSSVGAYMDGMADALKRLVADVPVVYTANGMQPMFQGSGPVGYDGLCVPGSGGGTLAANAGEVFSLSEHSSRGMWIISRLEPSGAAYSEKERLFGDINSLHDLGAKGFFAGGYEETAAGAGGVPTWLAEYASLSARDKRFASHSPQAIYYPKGSAKAETRRLASGIWWLPALAGGSDLSLGSSFEGYVIVDPRTSSADVYVWSLRGTRTIHLVSEDKVTLISTSGDSTEVKPKKGRVRVTLGEEPTLIRGIPPESFLPVETVEEALRRLEQAIVRMEEKKLDYRTYRVNLERARELLKNNQLASSLDMALVTTEEINLRLRGLEMEPTGSAGGEGAR